MSKKCKRCGACPECGQVPYVVYPQTPYPWPYPWPYPTVPQTGTPLPRPTWGTGTAPNSTTYYNA